MKIARASGFNLLAKLLRLTLSLISTWIFARNIEKFDFGQFAILMIPIQVLMPYLESGLSNLVFKTNDEEIRSVILTISNLITLVCAAIFIVVLSAFRLNGAIDLGLMEFAFLALHVLALGSLVIPRSILQKQKRFKHVMLYETFSVLLATCIAIIISYVGEGLLALICKVALDSTILYIITRSAVVLPKREKMSTLVNHTDIIRKGLGIALSRSQAGLAEMSDRIVFSFMTSIDRLGGYHFLKSVTLLPETIIRPAVTSAGFVYLADVNDKDSKGKVIVQIERMLAIVVFSPALLFFIYNDFIIVNFLGAKWIEESSYMRPLAMLVVAHGFKSIINLNLIDSLATKLLNRLFIIDLTFSFLIPLLAFWWFNSITVVLWSVASARLLYWLGLYLIWSYHRSLYSNRFELFRGLLMVVAAGFVLQVIKLEELVEICIFILVVCLKFYLFMKSLRSE
jgi:O-antigen/teichoic acid export membrane protein